MIPRRTGTVLMHPVYTLWNISAETADMLHEQLWLLVFVANLLHDKRKGEAENDGFEDSLEVCSVT